MYFVRPQTASKTWKRIKQLAEDKAELINCNATQKLVLLAGEELNMQKKLAGITFKIPGFTESRIK